MYTEGGIRGGLMVDIWRYDVAHVIVGWSGILGTLVRVQSLADGDQSWHKKLAELQMDR